MNIGSNGKYPCNALSNFAAHRFYVDGVCCNSMEGFLQSLKFDKPHIQVEVCKMIGISAKMRGKSRNKAWKRAQKLWWNGEEFGRKSKEYQYLLDKAFRQLAKSHSFQKAIIAAGDAKFYHSISRTKESETVLTIQEFCSRLDTAREIIKNDQNNR